MNRKLLVWLIIIMAIGAGSINDVLAVDRQKNSKWQPAGAYNVKSGRSPEINYSLHCAGCHGRDGTGVVHAGIPPFPGFIDAFFNDEQGRLYIMHVPGVASAGLENNELASVMNYIVDRWGSPDNDIEYFTTEEVEGLRGQEVDNVVKLRRNITQRLTRQGVELPEYPWP